MSTVTYQSVCDKTVVVLDGIEYEVRYQYWTKNGTVDILAAERYYGGLGQYVNHLHDNLVCHLSEETVKRMAVAVSQLFVGGAA